jgi:hypothetical protein
MTSLLFPSRSRAAIAALASSVLALGAAATLFGAESSNASSHREAPLLLADPQVDNTDVYAFVSPDKPGTVTLVGNWIPFEDPSGGPNFYPFATVDGARYVFNIDNNGDAKPDVVYRWMFQSSYRNTDTFLYNTGQVTGLNDPDLNFRQRYTLTKTENGHTKTLVRGAPVAPSNVGAASMPDYPSLSNAAITKYGQGHRKTFAGQADDSFFLDLRVFDLLYGGDFSEAGNDTLSGYNVNTIALQVPKSDLLRDSSDDPTVGIWSTTERRSTKVTSPAGTQSYRGPWVQVSRLGNPLVNEVVIPVGLKDAFNALKPQNDADVKPAVDKVLHPEVPKLIEAIYGIPAPKEPRNDLFKIFLTGLAGLNQPQGNVRPAELLRLNTSVPPSGSPNRLGVLGGDNAGFPNGRRLTDDVVDIELRALEGAVRANHDPAADSLSDGVDVNDEAFRAHFPYVALAHSGSETASPGGKTTPSAYHAAPDRRTAPPSYSAELSTNDGSAGVGRDDELATVIAVAGLAFGGLGVALLVQARRRRTVTTT